MRIGRPPSHAATGTRRPGLLGAARRHPPAPPRPGTNTTAREVSGSSSRNPLAPFAVSLHRVGWENGGGPVSPFCPVGVFCLCVF